MLRPLPERGSARATAIVLAALALLGGAAYFMTGDLPGVSAREPQSASRAGFTPREAPVVKESVQAAPKAMGDQELEQVKKGELVQYRDEYGMIKYRLKDPITGVAGNGSPLSFTLNVTPSPTPMAKGPKPVTEKGQPKPGRRTAPKLGAAFNNGKLTVTPPAGEGETKK